MAIIDTLRNSQGIRTLGTQSDFQHSAPGRGDILLHSNGRLYCVWAATYNALVNEKRIYAAYSTDNGYTWSARFTITSGYWDDDPCCVELDESADIGVVFNRERATVPISVRLYRVAITTDCLVDSPIDAITGTQDNLKSPSIIRTATTYMLVGVPSGYSTTLTIIENAGDFTNNSWTRRYTSVLFGSSVAYISTAQLKKLANDHLVIVATFRTAINGTTKDSNLRYDVGIVFSSTNGATWSAHQQLTNYTDAPVIDMVGIKSAASASLVQLSDGTLDVMYQEHTPFQVLKSTTTPSLSVGGTNVFIQHAIYHATKNLVIFGTKGQSNVTEGGLYILALDTGALTRITAATVPAIWSLNINWLALSSDDRYLALATEEGLEVIDTNEAAIPDWTVILSLRDSTSPALYSIKIPWIEFDPDPASPHVFYFSYSNSGESKVWGGKIDLNSPGTLVDLRTISSVTPGGSAYGSTGFVGFNGEHLVSVLAGYIIATAKSDGAGLYALAQTGLYTGGFYDDINDEYLYPSSTLLYRFRDTGSAFTLSGTIDSSVAGNPRVTYPSGYNIMIPGIGALAVALNAGFYSFNDQSVLGYLVHSEFLPYLNTFLSTDRPGTVLSDKSWIIQPQANSLVFIPLTNEGRLRHGVFTYNSGTLQVATADFYDMADTARVDATDFDELATPRAAVLPDDTVALYTQKLSWLGSPRHFVPTICLMEPDARRVTARIRISNVVTRSLQSQTRIRGAQAQTVEARVRIVTAQCIKARVFIVPRVTRTLTARVSIKTWKSTIVPGTFTVLQTNQTHLVRGYFSAATGYTGKQGITARVLMQASNVSRVTGHYIVRGVPTQTSPVTFAFGSITSHHQTLTAKVRLV